MRINAEPLLLVEFMLFSVGGSTVLDLPLVTGAWPGGTAMLTSSEIALNIINNRSDILPDYRLNLVYNNTNVRSFMLVSHI